MCVCVQKGGMLHTFLFKYFQKTKHLPFFFFTFPPTFITVRAVPRTELVSKVGRDKSLHPNSFIIRHRRTLNIPPSSSYPPRIASLWGQMQEGLGSPLDTREVEHGLREQPIISNSNTWQEKDLMGQIPLFFLAPPPSFLQSRN